MQVEYEQPPALRTIAKTVQNGAGAYETEDDEIIDVQGEDGEDVDEEEEEEEEEEGEEEVEDDEGTGLGDLAPGPGPTSTSTSTFNSITKLKLNANTPPSKRKIILSTSNSNAPANTNANASANPDTSSGVGPGAGPSKPKRVIKPRQSLADKQPGTTIFPGARVKRIIKADKELDMMSQEGLFMISVAAEYFIKHFMEEGYTKARLDKRKLVTYKDMATVVERSAEFDFLRDVIPLPIPMSEALAARRRKIAADIAPEDGGEPSNINIISNTNTSDVLPPLAPSTNPLFPNAIMKRPPNTHSKGPSGKAAAAASVGTATSGAGAGAGAGDAAAVGSGAGLGSSGTGSGLVLKGKNAPTTAQGLTTRSRRSLAAAPVAEEDSVISSTTTAPMGAAAAVATGEEAVDVVMPDHHEAASDHRGGRSDARVEISGDEQMDQD